jgi:hypothetical protein
MKAPRPLLFILVLVTLANLAVFLFTLNMIAGLRLAFMSYISYRGMLGGSRALNFLGATLILSGVLELYSLGATDEATGTMVLTSLVGALFAFGSAAYIFLSPAVKELKESNPNGEFFS